MRPNPLLLGTRIGTQGVEPIGVPPSELMGHALVQGSSGAGKTVFVETLLAQLLQRDLAQPMILIDPKGDLAGFDVWLGALSATLPPLERERFLGSVQVLAPFRNPDVELNLLAPTGEEPELQALDVTDAISTGLDSDPSYERLWPLLTCVLAAAIQVGMTLLEVPTLLTDEALQRQVAERLPEGYTKERLLERIKGTPRATIQALLARLDRLLLTSVARRLLSARRCFSWESRLHRGITILNLAEPPAGQAALAQLFGGVLTSRLTRALLARPVNDSTRPLMVVVDECHEVLMRRTGEAMGRLLALVRYKKVAIWNLLQDLVQLERRAPELVPLLQANTRLLFIFASSPSSVRWLAPFVPDDLLRARPGQRSGAAEAARRAFLDELCRLPQRVALYVNRSAGARGVFLATPTVNLDDVKHRAGTLPTADKARLGLIPPTPAQAHEATTFRVHPPAPPPTPPSPPATTFRIKTQGPTSPTPAPEAPTFRVRTPSNRATSPPSTSRTRQETPASPAPSTPTSPSPGHIRHPLAFGEYPTLGWAPWAPAPARPL